MSLQIREQYSRAGSIWCHQYYETSWSDFSQRATVGLKWKHTQSHTHERKQNMWPQFGLFHSCWLIFLLERISVASKLHASFLLLLSSWLESFCWLVVLFGEQSYTVIPSLHPPSHFLCTWASLTLPALWRKPAIENWQKKRGEENWFIQGKYTQSLSGTRCLCELHFTGVIFASVVQRFKTLFTHVL